VYCVW